jgi:hypothetical protein
MGVFWNFFLENFYLKNIYLIIRLLIKFFFPFSLQSFGSNGKQITPSHQLQLAFLLDLRLLCQPNHRLFGHSLSSRFDDSICTKIYPAQFIPRYEQHCLECHCCSCSCCQRLSKQLAKRQRHKFIQPVPKLREQLGRKLVLFIDSTPDLGRML